MKIACADIGGTSIKSGVWKNGETTELSTRPSRAKEGTAKMLEVLFGALDGLAPFDAVSVATAGMVAADGSIAYANDNIPGYTGTPLQKMLSKRYGVRAFVLGDIAAGALGAAENRRDFYYLSLGTGVGGIEVSDGKPRPGKNRIAGQVGYLDAAGGRGIIDDMASMKLLGADFGGGQALFDAATAGDKKAAAELAAWARQVNRVIAFIVGFIDPGEIVIGGAVAARPELYRLLAENDEVVPLPYRGKYRITAAAPGAYTGVAGAAKYATEELKI